MHFRRLACLLLGLWLGGSAVVTYVSASAGAPAARALQTPWGTAQLALGAAVFAVLLFGTHEGKFPLTISLSLLIWVALERFALPDAYPWTAGATAALAFILAGRLLLRRHGSGNARLKLDVIDVTDHRHVNG